jgi:hypothetical protein
MLEAETSHVAVVPGAEPQFPRYSGDKVRQHKIHEFPRDGSLQILSYVCRGTQPSQEEIEQFQRIFELIIARQRQGGVVCENCGAIYGHPACRGQHRSNADTGLILFSGCEECQCHNRKSRDPLLLRRLEKVYEVDQRRTRVIRCCVPSAIEQNLLLAEIFMSRGQALALTVCAEISEENLSRYRT